MSVMESIRRCHRSGSQTQPNLSANQAATASIKLVAAAQFLGHAAEPDPDPYVRLLQVADFVAGMTDSYAVDMYRKLKGYALPT